MFGRGPSRRGRESLFDGLVQGNEASKLGLNSGVEGHKRKVKVVLYGVR